MSSIKTNDKTVVEILPWLHIPDSQFHSDLIKYVRTFPKGSIVFFESDQEGLETMTPEQVKALRKMDEKQLRPIYSKINRKAFAFLEFFSLAASRGLKVIPLESRILFDRQSRLEARINSLLSAGCQMSQIMDLEKQFSECCTLREKWFSRTAAAFLRELDLAKVKKTYMIVGITHAEPVKAILQSSGYNIDINTSFARNTTALNNLIADYRKARKASRKGDTKAFIEASTNLEKAHNENKQPFGFSEFQAGVRSELERRQNVVTRAKQRFEKKQIKRTRFKSKPK